MEVSNSGAAAPQTRQHPRPSSTQDAATASDGGTPGTPRAPARRRFARADTHTRHSGNPQAVKSLGSERGLATPSPDGKGEKSLGPSIKIMPGDSYSTLGRSCEPAYQVDLRCAGAAGRRNELAGGWSADGRRAATRRVARLPDREVHLSSSRRGPGPDPASDGRGRGLPVRRAALSSAELG